MAEIIETRTTLGDLEQQLKGLRPTFTKAQHLLDKVIDAAENVGDDSVQALARNEKSSLTETERLAGVTLDEIGRLKTAPVEEISEEYCSELKAAGAGKRVTQEASAITAQVLSQFCDRLLNEDVRGFLQLLNKLIDSLRLSVLSGSTSVMKALAKTVRLDTPSGAEFEALIARLLEHMGFRAAMTKASGDGGVDVVARLDQPLIGGRYLIQCKRYAPDSPVGAASVREFYGALTADRGAVKGILITTSGFTAQAQEFARPLPIELIGREQLQGLLEQYGLVHPETPRQDDPVAQLFAAYGSMVEFLIWCAPQSTTLTTLRSDLDSLVAKLPKILRAAARAPRPSALAVEYQAWLRGESPEEVWDDAAEVLKRLEFTPAEAKRLLKEVRDKGGVGKEAGVEQIVRKVLER